MSKAILDGFMNSVITSSKRRYDVLVRRYLGKNQPHLITMTKEDFRDIIRDNFLKAMETTGKRTYPKDKEKLQEIADEVFKEYPTKFNNYATIAANKERQAVKNGNTITIYLPSYTENVRRAFTTLANQKLKKSFGRYSKEQAKKFTSLTQFLHTGGSDLNSQTVGTEQLRLLGNVASGEKVGTGLGNTKSVKGLKDFVTDEELESAIATSVASTMDSVTFSTSDAIKAGKSAIFKMVEDVDWIWSTQEKNSSNVYNNTVVVRGRLGPSSQNKPGEESLDWRNLKPKLEEAIFNELNKKGSKLATIQGSQSMVDKVAAGVEETVINGIVVALGKNKKLRVRADKPTKQSTPTNKKGKKLGKSTKITKTKSSINVKSLGAVAIGKSTSATKKNTRSRKSILNLQGLLNARLASQVQKNMRLPGLQNRTGRFASSVKVESITSTPKGYPSIGYTYDKNPYQIFELGAGKAPWASRQRDPRPLIEKSIREIATDVIKSRFYTRRL